MATCWCGPGNSRPSAAPWSSSTRWLHSIEKTEHYPDLIVTYRSVRIEISTHDVGGLTERDFELIAAINEVPTDR